MIHIVLFRLSYLPTFSSRPQSCVSSPMPTMFTTSSMASTNLVQACPGIVSNLTETPPVQFNSLKLLARAHDATPRWGYTSDFRHLLLGNNEDAANYLTGVLVGALIVGVVFVSWAIVLIICKCLGPQRVGLMSGGFAEAENNGRKKNLKRDDLNLSEMAQAVVYDSDSAAEDQSFTSSHTDTSNRLQTLKRVRFTLGISGAIMFVFCLIFIAFGVRHLLDALDDTRRGLNEAERLADGAVRLIDDFDLAQAAAIQATEAFSDQVRGFCPQICPDVTSDCDLSQIPQGESLNSVLSFSQESYIDSLDLPGIRRDLTDLGNSFADIDDVTRNFEWVFEFAIAFATVLAVLDLIFMYSLWGRTWDSCLFRCLAAFRKWFLVPLFALMVVLTWLFTEIFIVGSTMNNDFCVAGPDATISGFLIRNQGRFDSMILDFALYYTTGCQAERFPQGFKVGINDARSVLENTLAFAADIASDSTFLSETCGTTDPEALSTAAFAVQAQTCVWGSVLVNVQDFMSCNNWHGLYNSLAYSAVCYSAGEGFYWIAMSSFFMVLSAMVMLTLRAGFYDWSSSDVSLSKSSDTSDHDAMSES